MKCVSSVLLIFSKILQNSLLKIFIFSSKTIFKLLIISVLNANVFRLLDYRLNVDMHIFQTKEKHI